MAKRIDIDGKSFRIRRNQLVEIPAEWVGQTTHKQTINKRPSKQIHKLRRSAPKTQKTVGHQY